MYLRFFSILKQPAAISFSLSSSQYLSHIIIILIKDSATYIYASIDLMITLLLLDAREDALRNCVITLTDIY